MPATIKITSCPICGGQLQMTELREVYYDCDSFDFDGSYAAVGAVRFGDLGELKAVTLYCENNHTADEIEEFLENAVTEQLEENQDG